MRKRIIEELSNNFSTEEATIKKIIETTVNVDQYERTKINNRCVIDKSQIPEKDLILLEYYKLLINRSGRIRYPNRSNIMKELMSVLPYLNCYKFYTIYKFDFKKFFYNIDAVKCFEILNRYLPLKVCEYKFLKKYTTKNTLIPGIGLHNSLVEFSGLKFDFKIKEIFRELGLILYSRYVDDCILILDEVVEESLIEDQIKNIMCDYFGKKLALNDVKTYLYDSNSEVYKIDYLGYSFHKYQKNSKKLKFGISNEKLEKYIQKIDSFIIDYNQNRNVELLSIRLDTFFKRIVFWGERKGDKKFRWQVRGISDSYKEIKRFMQHTNDTKYITQETNNLFSETIKNSFNRNRVEIPAKIYNQLKNNKFKSAFVNNKAIILHRKIGLSYQQILTRVNILTESKVSEGQYNYYDLSQKLFKKLQK